VHLLGAEPLGRLLLVQPLEVAVVPLVQRLVADDRRFLRGDAENDVERLLSPRQHRGVGDVEAQVAQSFAGLAGFLAAMVRQRHVDPAGEPVLEVPERLAVADEDELRHRRSGEAEFIKTRRRSRKQRSRSPATHRSRA
jgi:hypothetical protein